MKTRNLLIVSLLSVPLLAMGASSFKDDAERLSYTIGADMGLNFKKQGIEINVDALQQGLKDGLYGGDTRMTKKEMEDTLWNLQKEIISKRKAEFTQLSDKNKKEGEAYLLSNQTQKGVVVLADGLQYKSIQVGKGNKPRSTDTVKVNYEGRLINGEVFDSSYKRGQPATFPLNQVIKGWQEALTLMSSGSIWEIYVPPSLAYGEQGVGGLIGPNQTLIFKVELISIESANDKG